MTLEMWVTLAILFIALILFITELIRLDIVALGVMTALMLFGILTIDEGIAGFSNKAVISIGALFIVGGAVFRTGLAALLAKRILQVAGEDYIRLVVVLMVAIALMSAFISSTGVVALMLPAVVSLSRSLKINTSKLMIPMAYSALLGGSLTLIGTPPNLLASEALSNAGFVPFDFFSFSVLGLVLLATGVVYMATVGRRFLPDRKPLNPVQNVTTPGELFTLYTLPGNLFRLRVQDDSPLIGLTIGESGLRRDYNLNLLSISHESAASSRLLLPVQRGQVVEQFHAPPPETRISANDVLLIQAIPDDMTRATSLLKLAVMANDPVAEKDIITNEVGIAEVLLRPRSELLGKTIADIRFGSTYHLTVLNVTRPGADADDVFDIKESRLKLGDVLLVQGEWKNIFALKEEREDFIVMGEREALQLGAFSRPDKAPITLLVLMGMVVAVAFNIFDLALASIVAAGALILSGSITVDDAYETIDLKTLLLMIGMLPMSTALQKVGLVDAFAQVFVDTLGQGGPLIVLGGLFVLTAILTQMLSNTATAVLLAPLALTTAVNMGVQPHAFVMAVAVASSMAFVTPLASPVNTLVMSLGNYRFNDYVKVGIPLLGLTFIISMVVLPILWPL